MLDEEECRLVAASLREAVERYGLAPNPTSVLARMIFVAERAARDGMLTYQDDEQVRLLGQASHVAICLERFKAVQRGDGLVKWLKRSLDRIADPTSQGLDRLFEIEVAGRLAQ